VTPPETGELLRAPLYHSPRNPFHEDGALQSFSDGGLLIQAGRVADCGDYAAVRDRHPGANTVDMRGGYILPGFIDAHVHFPQLRVLGALGHSLLEWLERCALPEESRMADPFYAGETARQFLHALASHGTTTALTFGAHFVPAMAALFEAAQTSGLRIVSGLVLSDRNLRPELHQTPVEAYTGSSSLIRAWHCRGRLLYAVTPRFALSSSEAMLEVCQTLLRENPGVRFQTHLNENPAEIAAIAKLFPWAKDYLSVYERYGLCSRGAVMAHNVHPTASELETLAANGASVAHCPASNAALGNGIFPLRSHLNAGVHCALGTDVGGGTGYGMLKEGLQAYLMQRVAPGGLNLTPAHLLYLATKAGAEALGLDRRTGDFQTGKAADFVYLRAPAGSPLSAVLETAESHERILAALFTLAGTESVREVRVEGSVVYQSAGD
jgi:guanine deaminase